MTTAEDRPEIDWGRAEWKRASACGDAACVEVAKANWFVAVRDTKNPDQAPLVFDRREWSAFVSAIQSGDPDLT